jgi:hypothetical protein
VPVVAIGGGLADDAGGVFAHGIDGLESATPNAMELDVAIRKSRQYLQDAAERVARLIAIGQRMIRKTAAAGTRKAAAKTKAAAKRKKVKVSGGPQAQTRTPSRTARKTGAKKPVPAARPPRRR